MFNAIQLSVVGLAAFLAGSGIFYAIGHWRGEDAGYDRRVAEVAIADGKAEMERKGDDATLQSMSDYELCVLGLGNSGMPDDACLVLRGVAEGGS